MNIKSVFELKPGMRVYDTFKNRYGRISSVRETSYEDINAFVVWDDLEKEQRLVILPNISVVSE